jgi:hypothetical protein
MNTYISLLKAFTTSGQKLMKGLFGIRQNQMHGIGSRGIRLGLGPPSKYWKTERGSVQVSYKRG